MKKIVVSMLIVMVLMVGVFAGQAQEPAKPSVLKLAAVMGVETRGLKAITPLFEAQTGIKVKLIEYPYHSLYEKIVTMFQARMPAYDLIMLDDPWMPKFAAEEWLVPLDKDFGYKKDPDIYSAIYDLGTWPPPYGPMPPGEETKERHLYGVTIVGNVEMFMYRADLMPEPKTWSDVLMWAEKLYNPDKPFYGVVIRGRKGIYERFKYYRHSFSKYS